MPDDNNDPLIEALADARERIAQLEQAQAAQQAASMSPEQREAAQRRAEGQALLDAVHAANRKRQLPPTHFTG